MLKPVPKKTHAVPKSTMLCIPLWPGERAQLEAHAARARRSVASLVIRALVRDGLITAPKNMRS